MEHGCRYNIIAKYGFTTTMLTDNAINDCHWSARYWPSITQWSFGVQFCGVTHVVGAFFSPSFLSFCLHYNSRFSHRATMWWLISCLCSLQPFSILCTRQIEKRQVLRCCIPSTDVYWFKPFSVIVLIATRLETHVSRYSSNIGAEPIR